MRELAIENERQLSNHAGMTYQPSSRHSGGFLRQLKISLISRSLSSPVASGVNRVVESYAGRESESTVWLNAFGLLFCDNVLWACFGPLEMIQLWAAKIVPQLLSVFGRDGCLAFTM